MATSSEPNSSPVPRYWSLRTSALSHTCLYFQQWTSHAKIAADRGAVILNILSNSKTNGKPERRGKMHKTTVIYQKQYFPKWKHSISTLPCHLVLLFYELLSLSEITYLFHVWIYVSAAVSTT